MLKDVVLRQKQEKERLLSFSYVERSKMADAQQWLDSEIIKIVVGPRRAGKSIFSLMLLRNRSFAYFNFDDESFQATSEHDLDNLLHELHAAYGSTKYILFDEIQNVPRWELFVNRLHRQGYNLVLTGSNAQLLSSELATALTGRHIPVEIWPFDFKEFLRAHNVAPTAEKNILFQLMHKYLLYGGYPEVVTKHLDARPYLGILFDSLVFKDVVRRHNVRFVQHIDNLGLYLVNNYATHYSLRKLAQELGFKSGVTLEKYVSYLIEAYIIFSLSRYNTKALERIKSPKKIYAVDNGFVAAKAVQHSPDFGRLMENLVFTELIKRGYQPNREMFYYKTRNDREIDFVLKQSTTVRELIQVVYDMNTLGTQQREVKALVEAAQEISVPQLTLLTWDMQKEIKNSDRVIHCVSLLDWLMQ